MSDLRQRLSSAMTEAFVNRRDVPGRDGMTDAALAVFGAWLRERAEEHRELAQQRPIGPTTLRAQRSATARRALLLALASETDPEEHHAD